MKSMRNVAVAIAAVLVAAVLSSCSKQESEPRGAAAAKSGEPIVVSVAASTKDLTEALAGDFKKESQAEIQINPGSSNSLATQILAGAPADLFLSASQQWADEVKKGGQADAMARLLTNKLVLIVPKGNPAQVHEPKDLLRGKVQKIALAGEKVPAGMYADQALTKLEILKQLEEGGKVARAEDVRGALTFVERGEAEAGIVYSTDVRNAPNVEQVYQFDPALHHEIVYVLVLLKHGSTNPAARELYEFLQSTKVDKIYTDFGFERLR
jgi:molybdate transport system substrate-binding protein